MVGHTCRAMGVVISTGIFAIISKENQLCIYSEEDSDEPYMESLLECNEDGAYFFVPNSEDEFNDVMAGADTGDKYFFGLQNWVRRGAGTTRETWTVATGYVPDTDIIWKWMDRDGVPLNVSLSNYYETVINTVTVDVHPSIPYIAWKNMPSSGDLITFLDYSSPNCHVIQ